MLCPNCKSKPIEEETRDSGVEYKRFSCFTQWRSDFGITYVGRLCNESQIEQLKIRIKELEQC